MNKIIKSTCFLVAGLTLVSFGNVQSKTIVVHNNSNIKSIAIKEGNKVVRTLSIGESYRIDNVKNGIVTTLMTPTALKGFILEIKKGVILRAFQNGSQLSLDCFF